MVIYINFRNILGGAFPTRTNREVYKFMRKTVKKLTAVGLTLTSVMGLVACGNNNASTENKSTVDWASVEKPEAFTVMVDGTVPQMEEWGDKFDEQLKELTGLDFTVTRPDHNSYYDAVANSMLDASAMPDVIILSTLCQPGSSLGYDRCLEQFSNKGIRKTYCRCRKDHAG